MAQVLVEEQSLSDTAAAIRSRIGGQDTYKPREFAAAINSIVDYASITQTISGASSSSNATKVAKGDGFVAEITPETGRRITAITVTMGNIDITDQVFKPGVGAKAITANGTYTAAGDNLSGYDTVTVAVPTGGGGSYTRTEICPSQTFTGDSSQRRATLTGMTAGFVDGAYYIITYDGVEWATTCETLWTANYCIGEAQWFLGTVDSVYPFGVIWMNGNTCTVAAADTSQHTIKIERLEFTASGADLGQKTITQNGTYAATSDNLDGYSSVTVNVSGGSPSLQTKTKTYTPTTSTQTETVTADAGYDGLQNVGVTVNPIPSQYIVPSGSQTITSNGTVDVTALAEVIVNVASGGSSVATGTVTPASASTTISFDTGLSTITGILVMPINTPLTGSRTQAAMICLPSGSFYKAISIHTNNGGTGWVSPSVYTSNRFSQSGTTVTVTGAYSFRPAVGYVWYAW